MEKKIFERTDGVRGKAGEEPLTPDTITNLSAAISDFFGRGKFIIARDTRASGDWIKQSVEAGLKIAGSDAIDAGILSTPALALSVKLDPSIVAGIMITASHNPASDNGIKIFHPNGDKLVDGEELEIEKIFFEQKEQRPSAANPIHETEPISIDAARAYIDHLSELAAGVDLSRYNIAIDSAAGSAHSLSQDLATQLNLRIQEIGPAPKGDNINQDCGSLYPEHLSSVIKNDSSIDIGICLDGDADRIVVVDDTGRIWDGDRIVTMLALHLKSEGKLSANTAVLTEYSNLAAVHYLEQSGITVVKVENGDRAVLEACRSTGACLGGEVAGHIVYTPWLSSSDGLAVAIMILSTMYQTGKKLSELWPSYIDMPSQQWGIKVRQKSPLDEIPDWSDALAQEVASLGSDGRIFVRYSGTEPKLRILVESSDMKKTKQVGDRLANIIRKAIGND